ncbi:MAG: ribonuclease domain-containing protein [Clostridiales bacterium]|nr:ribonuclease domain-containing protein [Clostridiales bacterium]
MDLMKKWPALALSLGLAAALLTACGGGGEAVPSASDPIPSVVQTERVTSAPEVTPEQDETTAGAAALDEDGSYSSKEDVALYLATYGELPDNFMTKEEARDLGWTGGSLEPYAPGMCIGGDRFGNYEGILPEGNYHECDIDTLGADSRGAKRIVWSEDGNIYYTEDHYESFELLYGEEE